MVSMSYTLWLMYVNRKIKWWTDAYKISINRNIDLRFIQTVSVLWARVPAISKHRKNVWKSLAFFRIEGAVRAHIDLSFLQDIASHATSNIHIDSSTKCKRTDTKRNGEGNFSLCQSIKWPINNSEALWLFSID